MSDTPLSANSTLPNNKIVCHCHEVSLVEILKAITEGGARTLQDVQRNTLAGTGCGFCKGDIEKIVAESVGE